MPFVSLFELYNEDGVETTVLEHLLDRYNTDKKVWRLICSPDGMFALLVFRDSVHLLYARHHQPEERNTIHFFQKEFSVSYITDAFFLFSGLFIQHPQADEEEQHFHSMLPYILLVSSRPKHAGASITLWNAETNSSIPLPRIHDFLARQTSMPFHYNTSSPAPTAMLRNIALSTPNLDYASLPHQQEQFLALVDGQSTLGVFRLSREIEGVDSSNNNQVLLSDPIATLAFTLSPRTLFKSVCFSDEPNSFQTLCVLEIDSFLRVVHCGLGRILVDTEIPGKESVEDFQPHRLSAELTAITCHKGVFYFVAKGARHAWRMNLVTNQHGDFQPPKFEKILLPSPSPSSSSSSNACMQRDGNLVLGRQILSQKYYIVLNADNSTLCVVDLEQGAFAPLLAADTPQVNPPSISSIKMDYDDVQLVQNKIVIVSLFISAVYISTLSNPDFAFSPTRVYEKQPHLPIFAFNLFLQKETLYEKHHPMTLLFATLLAYKAPVVILAPLHLLYNAVTWKIPNILPFDHEGFDVSMFVHRTNANNNLDSSELELHEYLLILPRALNRHPAARRIAACSGFRKFSWKEYFKNLNPEQEENMHRWDIKLSVYSPLLEFLHCLGRSVPCAIHLQGHGTALPALSRGSKFRKAHYTIANFPIPIFEALLDDLNNAGNVHLLFIDSCGVGGFAMQTISSNQPLNFALVSLSGSDVAIQDYLNTPVLVDLLVRGMVLSDYYFFSSMARLIHQTFSTQQQLLQIRPPFSMTTIIYSSAAHAIRISQTQALEYLYHMEDSARAMPIVMNASTQHILLAASRVQQPIVCHFESGVTILRIQDGGSILSTVPGDTSHVLDQVEIRKPRDETLSLTDDVLHLFFRVFYSMYLTKKRFLIHEFRYSYSFGTVFFSSLVLQPFTDSKDRNQMLVSCGKIVFNSQGSTADELEQEQSLKQLLEDATLKVIGLYHVDEEAASLASAASPAPVPPTPVFLLTIKRLPFRLQTDSDPLFVMAECEMDAVKQASLWFVETYRRRLWHEILYVKHNKTEKDEVDEEEIQAYQRMLDDDRLWLALAWVALQDQTTDAYASARSKEFLKLYHQAGHAHPVWSELWEQFRLKDNLPLLVEG